MTAVCIKCDTKAEAISSKGIVSFKCTNCHRTLARIEEKK